MDRGIIGGDEYTFDELCTWHPVHLARQVVKFQETRRTWHRADKVLALYVAALEAELKAANRELECARVELKLRRQAAKQRPVRRAA
jgi:hypothetical protein